MLFIIFGIFVFICALANVSFFMKHRKALFLVSLIGELPTRVLYMVIGLSSIVYGYTLVFHP